MPRNIFFLNTGFNSFEVFFINTKCQLLYIYIKYEHIYSVPNFSDNRVGVLPGFKQITTNISYLVADTRTSPDRHRFYLYAYCFIIMYNYVWCV